MKLTIPDARRHLLVAFSFANIFLVTEWSSFIYPNVQLLAKNPTFSLAFFGFLLVVLLLTLAAFAVLAVTASLKTQYRLASHLVLLGMLVFRFLAYRQLSNLAVRFPFFSASFWTSTFGAWGARAIFAGIAVALAVGLWKRGERAIATLRTGFTILFPLSLIFIAQGISGLFVSRTYEGKPVPPVTDGDSRVLVMIFDEFAASYLDKGKSASYPGLERFRTEAFEATNVTSPASVTLHSIPAYLTGNPPKVAEKVRDVAALPSDEDTKVFSYGDHLFADVRARGMKLGIVGFYFPYCAIFPFFANSCDQFTMNPTTFSDSLWVNTVGVMKRAFNYPSKNGESRNHWILARAVDDLIADPSYRFIYVHLSIPHLPGVGSRGGFDEDSYRENIAEVDAVVTRARASLEARGLWDRTHVIFTSDHSIHWVRCWNEFANGGYDDRIPFWVKLAGSKSHEKYDRRINSVFLRPLLVDMMDKKVASNSDLKTWLDAHGKDIPRVDPLINTCDKR